MASARVRLAPFGDRILFFNTVGSSNDAALSVADDPAAEGTIVLANAQTAGRGRRGREWFSPAGSGLYVSVVLRVPRGADESGPRTALLTLAAGVALAEAIELLAGLRVDIKWPNDLYVKRRKLAGILAEAVGAGRWSAADASGPLHDGAARVVLGYGINVSATAYPPELGERVTSLESELGRPIDRWAVLVETLAALARRHRDLSSGRFDAILDAWRLRAPASRGATVSWSTPAGLVRGETAGVDEQGALLVRVGDRLERIVGGELIWE